VRPRVLFVNNQGLASVGGGVTILRHLVHGLAEDHEVTVLSFDRPAPAPDGVRQRVLPPPPAAPGPLWRAAPLLRARHLRRAMPADALAQADAVVSLDCHFAHALGRAPSARIYLSLSCIPRMEAMAARGADATLRFAQYAWLERRMVLWARRRIVASRMQEAEMRRAERLPRGLAFDVLAPVFPTDPAPPAPAGQDPAVTILCGGRLVPGKNYTAAIALAARLHDLPCRFVVAGDGPEAPALKAQAAALGVEGRVAFLGEQPGLAAALAQTDIFLHPSSYESFGMAVFEAMQAGVPVMCASGAAVTACAEFVRDGVDGVFVDFADLDAAEAALRALVADPARRVAMGAAARQSAAALLAQDYVARFRAILAETLRAGR
jgi:glycosyltransferase involved in cell wall biosynthesis